MNPTDLEKKVAAYTGPKVAFVLTGGGAGVAQLATVVGASKLLHAILIPYSHDESVKLISDALGALVGEEYREKAVSEKSARLLCLGGLKRWPGCRVIACTAATTTSRWRRGENQAFVAVGEFPMGTEGGMVIKEYHLKLSKFSEEVYNTISDTSDEIVAWKRRTEDSEITAFIFKLVFDELGKKN